MSSDFPSYSSTLLYNLSGEYCVLRTRVSRYVSWVSPLSVQYVHYYVLRITIIQYYVQPGHHCNLTAMKRMFYYYFLLPYTHNVPPRRAAVAVHFKFRGRGRLSNMWHARPPACLIRVYFIFIPENIFGVVNVLQMLHVLCTIDMGIVHAN